MVSGCVRGCKGPGGPARYCIVVTPWVFDGQGDHMSLSRPDCQISRPVGR